ncbi:Uncharacterized protein FWK35_00012462 [Aphis craccivora]|uniref:Uncharacterized protein n=1 Tax=Aphis craccivora TaxID=307492 RepID=A0A6G0XWK2_APHCR|nr:Uncharacterized protein FWK35_00012462 [Aphis craccivora]
MACIIILDSERSDEYIDFTMMCFFFFVSVTTFWSLTPVSGRKVNLVGTLGGQNVRKNPKKVTEKREFLRKTSFRPNRFFYIVVYVSVTYIHVDKKNLDDQKHLQILNKVPYELFLL